MPVAADWKIVMRQLLDAALAGHDDRPGRRQFLWPNLLRGAATGCLVDRAGAADGCRPQPRAAVRVRGAYRRLAGAGAASQRARSLARTQLEHELAIAASTQQGETDPDYRADTSVTPSPAVSAFQRMLLDAEY